MISNNSSAKIPDPPWPSTSREGFAEEKEASVRSTNQLMCRDLNGRRMATVAEENKLKKWVEKAAEREKLKQDKKRAKIEKLKEGTGKHQFNDPDYIQQRDEILEKTEEAFEHDQGLRRRRPSRTGHHRHRREHQRDSSRARTRTSMTCLIMPDLEQTQKARSDPDVDKQAKEWAEKIQKGHDLKNKRVKILTKRQLEREYKEKRALATQHDVFLVDSRVAKSVNTFLGKEFDKVHK